MQYNGNIYEFADVIHYMIRVVMRGVYEHRVPEEKIEIPMSP
jgi:hypothetical protein